MVSSGDCSSPRSNRAVDSAWNSSRSSYGTPSSSQITSDGIGIAKCSTRSLGGPACSIASSRPVDDLVDARQQPLQPAHGELRRQHLAHPRVVRRVGHAEPAGVLLLVGAGDVQANALLKRGRVAEHRLGLVVAGDQPGGDAERQLQLADRLARPALAELGDRVEAVPREQQRHEHHLGHLGRSFVYTERRLVRPALAVGLGSHRPRSGNSDHGRRCHNDRPERQPPCRERRRPSVVGRDGYCRTSIDPIGPLLAGAAHGPARTSLHHCPATA